MQNFFYKYRHLDERAINDLYHETIYCSDPLNFNDPLDCKPTIGSEPTDDDLFEIFRLMLERRLEHEERVSRTTAQESNYRRQAGRRARTMDVMNRYAGLSHDEKRSMLETEIASDLKTIYSQGVYCLSEEFANSLMWSHYSNNHKGICFEFDVINHTANLQKVDYDSSRQISSTCLRSWLKTTDPGSEELIRKACMLTKAPDWRYEKEWRYFNYIGSQSSPFNLSGVIFGMQCPTSAIFTIASMLKYRKPDLKLWKMRSSGKSFELERHLIDTNALLANPPRV